MSQSIDDKIVALSVFMESDLSLKHNTALKDGRLTLDLLKGRPLVKADHADPPFVDANQLAVMIDDTTMITPINGQLKAVSVAPHNFYKVGNFNGTPQELQARPKPQEEPAWQGNEQGATFLARFNDLILWLTSYLTPSDDTQANWLKVVRGLVSDQQKERAKAAFFLKQFHSQWWGKLIRPWLEEFQTAWEMEPSEGLGDLSLADTVEHFFKEVNLLGNAPAGAPANVPQGMTVDLRTLSDWLNQNTQLDKGSAWTPTISKWLKALGFVSDPNVPEGQSKAITKKAFIGLNDKYWMAVIEPWLGQFETKWSETNQGSLTQAVLKSLVASGMFTNPTSLPHNTAAQAKQAHQEPQIANAQAKFQQLTRWILATVHVEQQEQYGEVEQEWLDLLSMVLDVSNPHYRPIRQKFSLYNNKFWPQKIQPLLDLYDDDWYEKGPYITVDEPEQYAGELHAAKKGLSYTFGKLLIQMGLLTPDVFYGPEPD